MKTMTTTSESKNLRISLRMAGDRSPLIDNNAISKHKHKFPVIQIDQRGRILYANKAAFPLLRDWNCLANDYLPAAFMEKYPSLFDLDADTEISLDTKSTRYQLDVIGFRESGYVGLYGFRVIYKNEENAPEQIHAGTAQ